MVKISVGNLYTLVASHCRVFADCISYRLATFIASYIVASVTPSQALHVGFDLVWLLQSSNIAITFNICITKPTSPMLKFFFHFQITLTRSLFWVCWENFLTHWLTTSCLFTLQNYFQPVFVTWPWAPCPCSVESVAFCLRLLKLLWVIKSVQLLIRHRNANKTRCELDI